jgi:hypothetical protein
MEEKEVKTSYASNSVSGQAIIKIFISFKNNEFNFEEFFKSNINNDLLFILKSNEPSLLDCGTNCLYLLLNEENSFKVILF